MRSDFAAPSAARTFDLEELVSLVHRGHVRVPHFQRDFRWEARDVRRLFDSIVKGYPVGSLLLWRRPAPAARLLIGALEIEAPEVQDAFWVVDGQQRLTSLANALTFSSDADPRFALSYDLLQDEFVGTHTSDQATSLPLPVLFDLRRLLAWFNEHPDMADHVSRANDVATQLRKYAVPSYIVDSDDVEILQDIFDRMNNFGKRLSRAEIFSALYAPDEGVKNDTLTIAKVAEECDELTGFGRIDDDTVLRVILARRGPDIAREIRIEFDDERRSSGHFPNETRDDAFEAGQASLLAAIRFLQDVAHIPHFSFLPYRYLLVVVARFLAHFPYPDERNVQLLRRWFWRTALAGPEIFKGSATGAMRQLCTRVDPGDQNGSVQALLQTVHGRDLRMPDLQRFRTNEAATRIVLCAMWARGPRSLSDGAPIDRQVLSSALDGLTTAADIAREVLPRRAVPQAMRTWAANRVLLPGEDEPVDTSSTFGFMGLGSSTIPDPGDVLESHFFDTVSASALASDEPSGFLELRQAYLERRTWEWISAMCETGHEDTPPLDSFDLDDIAARDDLGEVVGG